jgi:hypothetical protein
LQTGTKCKELFTKCKAKKWLVEDGTKAVKSQVISDLQIVKKMEQIVKLENLKGE